MPCRLIPGKPADVTPEWLGAASTRDGSPVEVRAADTGATYRVSVTYADPQPDLPASFAIKLPSRDDAVRDRLPLRACVLPESRGQVQIPIPPCYHCGIAGEGGDSVVLLGDMAPAVQGDQIAGCSTEEPRLGVEALADLHGPTWCDPQWADFPGIAMPRPEPASARGFGEVATWRRVSRWTVLATGCAPRIAKRHRRNVGGDAVAAVRAGPVRGAARRLPPRQHALRSGPVADHRGGLADPQLRAAGAPPVTAPAGTWPSSPRPACSRRPGRRSNAIWSGHTTGDCSAL